MEKNKILSLFLILGVCGSLVACKGSDISSSSHSSASFDGAKSVEISFSDIGIEVEGDGATAEGNVLSITKGGEYIISGTSESGAILVNCKDEVNIILNGLTLTNPTGPVIYGENSKAISITTADGTDNVLTDGATYDTDEDGEAVGKGVIFSNDDLYISGEGTLTINANYKHAVVTDDDLYLAGGTVVVASAPKDGFNANGTITVDGGSYNINAQSDLIQAEGDVIINAGTISGSSQNEGIEGKNAVYVNGGNVDISAKDDGINAGKYIEINGGTTYVTTTTGDAVDSNGSGNAIVINGGFLLAQGGNAPEGGLDCDNASIVINGGTVIATGDANSAISEDSKQVSILYGSFEANVPIGILDASGNTVFAYNPTVSGTNMIISVPEITSGESYTIYTGGAVSGECDNLGYYTAAEYEGGNVALELTVESQVVSAGGTSNTMGGPGGFGGNGHGGFGGDGDFNREGFDKDDFKNGEMPEMTEEQRKEMEEMFKNGQMPQRGQRPEEKPNN